MNSYSALGIFVFLLFAYCLSTQGYKFAIVEAEFENGQTYITDSGSNKSVTLFESSDSDTYEIEAGTSTTKKFKLAGIDTMMGKDLVLRTGDNTYLRVELANPQDSLRLFSMTTLSRLGGPLYSYDLSEVYHYGEGRIVRNGSISGFEYSTTGTPQRRFLIHSGRALYRELKLHVLWTEQDFNFHVYRESMILILRTKPTNETPTYRYYLVNFRHSSDLHEWMGDRGRCYDSRFPSIPTNVYNYFQPHFKYD